MPIPDYIRDDPQYSEMILYDGLENAFVGIAYRFTDGPFAVYDRSKVIESMMADDMDRETAEDNFEFNIAGLWAGDNTPIFIDFVEAE